MTNSSGLDFYQTLPSFRESSEMLLERHYQVLPEDWCVVLTDIRNSTVAIDRGLYKEVNMIGASCIISVQNALAGLDFPFIFGGDGATLLVHQTQLEKTLRALSHTRQMARHEFGFELRIASIPVQKLYALGKTIRVAKLELSPGNFMAVVQGGALNLAEKIMKQNQTEYALSESYAAEGAHTGLECRWNPVPTLKKQILALIIQTQEQVANPQQIYTDMLQQILLKNDSVQPITMGHLPVGWPPKNLWSEMKLRFEKKRDQWVGYVKALGFTFLAAGVILLKKNDRSSTVAQYLEQLTQNTDFLKFDDCLRMILDVDESQMSRILKILENGLSRHEIFYGYHTSQTALMTCYIQSPQKHFHFVDAGDGGYALAAKMLKAQKLEKQTPVQFKEGVL